MSTSTLANIVKQMRESGDSEVVLDCDGQAVVIELRPAAQEPAPAAPKPKPKFSAEKLCHGLMRLLDQSNHQRPHHRN